MSKNDADSMLDYFERYRQKKQELKDLTEEVLKTRALMEKKQKECQKMAAEIRSMQKIITAMIDGDMDPVEVKLRNDIPLMTDSLWDGENSVLLDEVTLSIAGGTMAGAIGATGALGATSTLTMSPHSITSMSSVYPYSSAGASIGSKYSQIKNSTT